MSTRYSVPAPHHGEGRAPGAGSLVGGPLSVWSPRTVLSAAFLTAVLFLMIPYLELLTKRPVSSLKPLAVEPVRLPPPPRPPQERVYEDRNDTKRVPRPRLRRAAPTLIPVRANLNLELVLGDVRGDFALDFDIAAPDLVRDLGNMVFELAQVDEPPRPLVRLQPIYPPAARIREIQGEVEVEFVVNADGTTAGLEVVSALPGDVFVNAALRAIRLWRFQPGTRNGEPVAVRVRQKVSFRIQGDGP